MRNNGILGLLRRLFGGRRLICRLPKKPVIAPIAVQKVYVTGKGSVSIGRDVRLGYKNSPGFYSTYTYIESRYPQSSVRIGEGCWFNNGCSIISASREVSARGIVIGDRVLLGCGVQIYDSDFHGMTVRDRNNPEKIRSASVVIGDDCWIGNNAIILKGVVLGSRCVVGAGSVVTSSYPEDSVIAGNPARLIKRIDQGT